MCLALGRRSDVHLSDAYPQALESTFAHVQRLQSLKESLMQEHEDRQGWIRQILVDGSALCLELDEPNPFPPDLMRWHHQSSMALPQKTVSHGSAPVLSLDRISEKRSYTEPLVFSSSRTSLPLQRPTDLSWPALRPLENILNQLRLSKDHRVSIFNEIVSDIQCLAYTLDHVASDDLDRALVCLFEKKVQDGMDWYDLVKGGKEGPLRITPSGLRRLQQRRRAMITARDRRRKRREELVWGISTLYDKLDWPLLERMDLTDTGVLSPAVLGALEATYARLKAQATKRRWFQLLYNAETDDKAREIHVLCTTLGYQADCFLPWLGSDVAYGEEPDFAFHQTQLLRSKLVDEVKHRKRLVVSCLMYMRALCYDLRLNTMNQIPSTQFFPAFRKTQNSQLG